MDLYALIVAGGSGKRMGTDIPKQFLKLAGKPVLMHTIERFRSFNESIKIIVVLPENQFNYWTELQKKESFSIPHTLIKGGPHRFFSVKNGLEHIKENGLVAIHDGVRPLVTNETIQRCFETALELGNAIPAITPADSVRMISGKGTLPVKRQDFRIIQTPQVFDVSTIKNAYLQEYNPEFTDDATLLGNTGEDIHLVEGNRENIKITTPEDLKIAEAFFRTFS